MKDNYPNETKREYVRPTITILHVELEEGIASGSATLRVGVTGSLDTPEVDDWTNGGSIGDSDIEL
ncbi:hypothetical protein CMT37_12885 [Elizabethkingia anophelis]|nr:hypothetical protein [Elizabethkingia anophelis]